MESDLKLFTLQQHLDKSDQIGQTEKDLQKCDLNRISNHISM